MKEHIYIVLSKTGTFPSKIIRLFSEGKYCHSSICLRDDIKELYSFGRLHPYKAFCGGFVKESPDYGTFKRFCYTEVSILRLKVEKEQYNGLSAHLENMYKNKERYKYNYKGIFSAIINKEYKRKDYFYCSEFIYDCLVRFGVIDKDILPKPVKPMYFMSLPNAELIYTGPLSAFAKPNARKHSFGDFIFENDIILNEVMLIEQSRR